ncbi:putative MFS transporter [Aureobasidium pullulans]|uniref:Putative MFS transporter n=1 Tax=Aureobasidium pullulans TaxID=5580 RepID=A0A4S9P1R3_AURPU|nr:putative MFS transporter [Aureobasidium pullulans]THZ75557.1 putative MFS transporter [Aureobasidium pullulans]
MSASRMYGSKIYEEKLDALSLQLSNTSTLVENSLDIAAPHELFEGGEYYDPLATWTPEEESKVKMKTDVRLLGWLSVMYFGMQLDSTSMANALADNFLHDLGFDMTEYGNSNRAWTQAWMQNEAGFYVTRALIGLCEGAFAPLTVMCLSGFYTNIELGFRIAILSSGINIAKALSSLIAAGILNMRGIGGKPGWFYLLLINGLVVFVIGIISVLYLPAGPTRTQSVLYRKPWFSEREKVIVINRLLRDDVSKGKTSTKEKTSLRDIWNTLKDPALIGFWFLALIIYMGKSPVSQYLVLNLRQLGFTRFESTVLTIPSDFLRTVTVLALTWSSGHFKEKVFHCIIPGCIEIPLFAALLILPPHGYSWVRFAIITLIIGSPSSHPIMASWISVNSFDPKKRGITIALFGTFHEIGSIAAAQIYRDDDKPYYYTGNKVLISICAVSIVGLLIHREVLKHINRKKQRAWESLSEVEQREYSKNQEHSIGNKSLTFRFSY